MLTKDLLLQSLPALHLHDKVHTALQLMNDNHITHLPITEGEKFIGIISEDELMQAENDHDELQNLQQSFANFAVNENEHFLKAVQIAVENGLSLVPVVDDENELSGVLVYSDLLKHAARMMNLNESGGLIVLEMDSSQYSFSEISKLAETNDAQITQLNTTTDPVTGLLLVTIRLNKTEVSDIVATFQRYEYHVKYYFGEELYENELRTNFDNLMNYLKI
jgi:predicted transcriptional regulator